jgi:FkbM family methyltransferase
MVAMGLKKSVFDAATGAFVAAFRLDRATKLSCGFAEKIAPVYRVEGGGLTLLLDCPNELTRSRAETFFEKEPETLEWIDGFGKGETLFDVGANIGLYTLYAASRGMKVFAFEPESQNYALLNRNVYRNGLADRVTALNVALSDKDALGALNLPRFYAGAALNNFGENLNWKRERYEPAFRQGVIAFSLDSFLARHPEAFPDHLKIDVDGAEIKIVLGAEKTLRDPRLKSLSVEINEELPEDLAIVEKAAEAGLRVLHKKHSDMVARSEFKRLYNYVFVRSS